MTALKGAHDMQNSSDKISDKEIQLYLMGELLGPKADLIRGIELTSIDLISSERDLLIKERIAKLRKVDSLLLDAANNSYKMPLELEQKISSTLALKVSGPKKRRLSLFSWLQNKLQEFDLASLVSGGAVAALSMFVIIEIQPDLLVDPKRVQNENLQSYRAISSRNSEDPCSSEVSNNWIVSEKFLYAVSVCSNLRGLQTLDNQSSVEIGNEFIFSLIPLTDFRLSVAYRREDGKKHYLKNDILVTPGKTVKLPDDTALVQSYKFSGPSGTDAFIIYVDSDVAVIHDVFVK